MILLMLQDLNCEPPRLDEFKQIITEVGEYRILAGLLIRAPVINWWGKVIQFAVWLHRCAHRGFSAVTNERNRAHHGPTELKDTVDFIYRQA